MPSWPIAKARSGLRRAEKQIRTRAARRGVYIFPKAPNGASASEFVARAIANNVLIIPGNVFSERDTHFRISYATTDEKLAKGCQVLCSLV